MGSAGISDTLYVKSAAGIRGFDGYVNRAFEYLDKVERVDRREAGRGALEGPTQHLAVQQGGAQQGSQPRVANLQLAMEVLVQLRLGSEEVQGASKPWGCMLALLSACPGLERGELLVRILQVALPIGDAAMQLAQAIVKEDVGRVQVPSLLASANNLDSALAQALLRLAGGPATCKVLDKELSDLMREMELIPASVDAATASSAMHRALEHFIATLRGSLRLGGEACFPPDRKSVV